MMYFSTAILTKENLKLLVITTILYMILLLSGWTSWKQAFSNFYALALISIQLKPISTVRSWKHEQMVYCHNPYLVLFTTDHFELYWSLICCQNYETTLFFIGQIFMDINHHSWKKNEVYLVKKKWKEKQLSFNIILLHGIIIVLLEIFCY